MFKFFAIWLTFCVGFVAFAVGSESHHMKIMPQVDGHDHPFESSHRFDPYALNVGDQVKSWTITKIEHNYFQAPAGFSVMTSFEGVAEVSGTFEYRYDDTNYNSGDIILTLDQNSTIQVPIPEAYGDRQSTRIILLFDDEEDRALFGPPGTTGTTTLIISDYQTLLAEAYGGVIDNARFEKLIHIETIPPDSPEKMNLDHLRNIEDFKPLALLPEALIDADASKVFEWLLELSRTFNQGLQMDERRITEQQRAEFVPWLHQAFTPLLTASLMDRNIPQVQGGYIVAGFLDIIPAIGPYTTGKHKFTQMDDSHYRYTVQLSGGATIVTLTCILVYEDNQWKIDQYTHQY